MHFALLGDHPDGIGMATALAKSGRHSLTAYCGSPRGLELLRLAGLSPESVGDVEEVLADPAIAAVIVAGRRTDRAAQLRRALQSERHVLCVHPPDDRPDIAYEAVLLQKDARVVLLPLLPEAVHPAVHRLAELAKSALGGLQLVEMERWSATGDNAEPVPLVSLPGWDVLRVVGGEIAEASAYTAGDELTSADPVLLSGRFETGVLFRGLFLPNRAAPRVRIGVLAIRGQADLLFPSGASGPAILSWSSPELGSGEQRWDAWEPWPRLVEAFDQALESPPHPLTPSPPHPTWQDALRWIELDDAIRRSARYRRVSTLEYPEASEEVGFKGTMTLVGCAILWVILLLVILSRWWPWLGWLILPALAFFLGLQALRWLMPRPTQSESGSTEKAQEPLLRGR